MEKIIEEFEDGKPIGVTRISLRNIERLISVHGKVKLIFHSPYPNPKEPYTKIIFQDGFSHTATGFSCGYLGEGPNGLATVCTEFLDRDDIVLRVIASLVKDGSKCYLFTRGQGTGKEMIYFMGMMDCEYDLFIF